MNIEESQYLASLEEIIKNGIESNDRTGVGTKFLFSKKFDYDISNGKIPIWTTRKVPWKNQVEELIFFIRGERNVKWLQDRGVNIWNSWCDESGDIGPTYSKQLRSWEHGDEKVDQLVNLIQGIKQNPESRRHIISLWNPGEYHNLSKPYLPSCHSNHIQIVIDETKKDLYYQMVQRSADMPIGYCPWQHALFANIIGSLTGYKPKTMSIIVSNAHVYNNQVPMIEEQIKRVPVGFPTLKMNENIKTLQDVENSSLSDYELLNYNPQSFIRFPIAI